LIALEGIDGAGTTTQARMLSDWMRAEGLPVQLTCEPSGGPLGQLIRQVLTHRTRVVDRAALALLFAGDRVDHLQSEVEPQLSQGVHVITDRYVYSSLAYQSLDLEPGWVAEINRLAPEPDLTLYLRVDPEVGAARRAGRGSAAEVFETTGEQCRIAATYDAFFGSKPDAGSWRTDPDGSGWIRGGGPSPGLATLGRRPTWAVVDGSHGVEAIHNQLRKLVQKICAPG